MPRFILTGDLTRAGRIVVTAESSDEAIEKAERGEFGSVFDANGPYEFAFCGDTDGGIEIEEAAR